MTEKDIIPEVILTPMPDSKKGYAYLKRMGMELNGQLNLFEETKNAIGNNNKKSDSNHSG